MTMSKKMLKDDALSGMNNEIDLHVKGEVHRRDENLSAEACISTVHFGMDGVDRVLNSVVSQLILQFAQTMETAGAEPTRINHIRTEAKSVTFSAEWSVLLEELQSSLYDTTHSRYSKEINW
ncbi:hypothetical protein L210DRAFT_983773 [Boletus edulis BED1]|uniref:Uncharacterized protein n=1 Tax=Boletus edulis BED1 TaxID=1328754 RepID=A0AAD4G6L8_BOLED|nr:hypothetical protein L210DRAFT_983773 [Boletus edulis BED1]